MDINKALGLARHARFLRIPDYRRDAYSATVGEFLLIVEREERDVRLGDGYGIEHDDKYLLMVFKDGVRLCADVFSRSDLAGFGSPLHTETEGDERILSLYSSLVHHRPIERAHPA